MTRSWCRARRSCRPTGCRGRRRRRRRGGGARGRRASWRRWSSRRGVRPGARPTPRESSAVEATRMTSRRGRGGGRRWRGSRSYSRNIVGGSGSSQTLPRGFACRASAPSRRHRRQPRRPRPSRAGPVRPRPRRAGGAHRAAVDRSQRDGTTPRSRRPRPDRPAVHGARLVVVTVVRDIGHVRPRPSRPSRARRALRSPAASCVTEIRRWVVDEAAPHDDVGLLILDRFPCPQDTLAAETAALGDPLRALVVEMSDELNPHDSVVAKGPLGDETERLHRETTASNPTIEPVERLGSTRGEVELNTDLTNALV